MNDPRQKRYKKVLGFSTCSVGVLWIMSTDALDFLKRYVFRAAPLLKKAPAAPLLKKVPAPHDRLPKPEFGDPVTSIFGGHHKST